MCGDGGGEEKTKVGQYPQYHYVYVYPNAL